MQAQTTSLPNWRVQTMDGGVLDEGELANFKQAQQAARMRSRILGERILLRRFREGWEDYAIYLPEGVVLACPAALAPRKGA